MHVDETVDADLARRCWLPLEILHVVPYWAPETQQAYTALDLQFWQGYVASRAGGMGRVGPAAVVPAFYVWAPRLVEAAVPSAWERVGPEEVVAARYAAAGAALHRLLDEVADPAEVAEAAALAGTAGEGLRGSPRALYLAAATAPEPADPLTALWHAATLLREHRGDGHVAVLQALGVAPVEALLLNTTREGAAREAMRSRRAWPRQDWDAAVRSLQGRGLLDAEGTLTADGAALRAEVETRTDALAVAGWQHLGAEGSARLLELTAPWREALLSSGALPDWQRERR
ncbi:hypothetical protein CLV92_103154 [Kineococcus xinjiangensis]|uniref:SalK n=1 Tax=Kineococcus xinjiangensis TaxID=512762 RepID=A0A2S6ITW5_9ACTN|nr:hypothetical protein [Kineococcus xinjiangensis]PPK97620.1 hypothetical protein CLV92_103154 [Kineococcus xinjiangensis]